MPHQVSLGDDDTAVRRIRRELARLEALARRRRMRTWIARVTRGLAGAGGSFAVMVKLKVAGSLGGKLVVAALVGLGVALPMVVLGVLALAVLVLAIVQCDPGGGSDCPGDCGRRNARRERLTGLIDERVSWLASRDGPAPCRAPDRDRARARRRRWE